MSGVVTGAGPGPWWRWWWWRSVAVLVLTPGVAVLLSAGWVGQVAAGRVFPVDRVPVAPVALVLGAEVYPDGSASPFLQARLEVARRLFAAGRVRAVLVSGDHGRWSYDEPGVMRRWLVERGVPPVKVVVDHAGFDTYDSCSRARRVFGVDRAVVVTQSFHVQRAVALCRAVGVDAVGVGDDSVARFRGPWLRGSLRERLAAVKASWDVLSGRDPVFLGWRETGVDRALRG